MKLDPWGSSDFTDYKKLIKEFGIKPFRPLLEKINDPDKLMRREIIYGHRDYERIIEAMKNKKEFCLITGFMPSGKPHLGHKMVMEEIIWHQKKGAKIYVCIADIEAYTVRKMSRELCDSFGKEYLAYLIALGLKADKNTRLYFQSKNKNPEYHAFSKFASRKTTFNEMKDIYGELTPGKIVSSLTQVADILLPQIENGPMPTVVPVGSDQDPHIRFTRDIASRFSSEFPFILPSSTYHMFQRGLDGGKMSSSRENSYISLDESEESLKRKIMNAVTGGRETLQEQKEKGGIPEKCMIFELFKYHLIENDEKLNKIYSECKSGSRICGECKKQCFELMLSFLKKLNEKKEKCMSKIEKMMD